ncbi:MAG: 3-keto-disaccharide hydrolase [Pirellulaceae bacterium]
MKMMLTLQFRLVCRFALLLLGVAYLPLSVVADDNSLVLFDGQDLSGWREPVGDWLVVQSVRLDPGAAQKFVIDAGQGIMLNGQTGRASNILSKHEHGDVACHLEFCVPQNSNSGVYFMGRYEIQVFDSWGVEHPKYSDCGGIYERWRGDKGYEGILPRANASKAPGEWQSLDVLFRAPRLDAEGKKIENARFVKVVLNGQVIHENVEVTGPTRAATYENEAEKPAGPLMLQGDHGPVAYRNITLKPIEL